jgi:hypothetical protein
VIAYPAMLDVPRELVHHLARLLAAERRVLGTRRGTRALTCFYQALLVLIWFRKAEDTTLLGAGFGVSRATAYRYVAEGIAVLAARRPELHEALRRAANDGWAFVIIDGKLFDSDRLDETSLSVKGAAIDAWYSGKHRDFGGEHPSGHAPGRHSDLDLRRHAWPSPRPDLRTGTRRHRGLELGRGRT